MVGTGDALRGNIAIEDLKLEHLWVVYPGTHRYPMTGKITALPLMEIDQIDWNASPGQ